MKNGGRGFARGASFRKYINFTNTARELWAGHSPMVKLVMRVAHVAPIRARCFNSKRTSFHVALELEHVESVNLRSAIREADAVLPGFACAGQRSDTLKRVAQRGRCRLLFLLGVQHIFAAEEALSFLQVDVQGAFCRCNIVTVLIPYHSDPPRVNICHLLRNIQ